MRTPLIFLGPNGSWDLKIFESALEAEGYAEPPDVQAGEYGARGWDADGKPVALEVKLAKEPRGFYGELLRPRSKWEAWSSEIGTRVAKWLRLQPQLEVRLRELVAHAEPEALREALIGRLAGLEPDLVEGAAGMALDDLIALVRRSTHERLQALKQGRYPAN